MRAEPLRSLVVFWTSTFEHAPCRSGMRRELEIRVAFAPTRLSAEHLRAAYEMVSAVVDRTIVRPGEEVAERELGIDVARQGQRGTR